MGMVTGGIETKSYTTPPPQMTLAEFRENFLPAHYRELCSGAIALWEKRVKDYTAAGMSQHAAEELATRQGSVLTDAVRMLIGIHPTCAR